MKEYLVVSVILLMNFSICIGQQEKPKPDADSEKGLVPMDLPKRSFSLLPLDSTLLAILGDSLPARLNGMRDFCVHATSSFLSEEGEESQQLEGFPIQRTANINADSLRALTRALGDSESYFLSEYNKMCYFLPNMGLSLFNQSDTVNILISLECNMVRFYFRGEDGKKEFRTFDSDPAASLLREVYREYFPVQMAIARRDASEKHALSMQLLETPLYVTAKPGDGWTHIARRANRQYGLEIDIMDICKVNNYPYKDAISNKIFPLVGERILVGFK
ncbi:MAG: hypothetical protein H6558_00280 [Lewinellaceae bacterium]|nr:hypothetical protein [Lewinellaceae bacterium]